MDANTDMGDFNHLLMLAIEQAFAPPIVHRRSTLQPMRIVVVDRETFLPAVEKDEVGRDMPRLLPRAAPQSPQTWWQFHQRAVRGEILSDETGRLYEKLGRQIRPLHHLASGPFGEVIDIVPAQQRSQHLTVPAPQPHVVNSPDTTNATARDKQPTDANEKTADSKFVPVQGSTNQVAVSHRKLFADPGQWRVLWWGEFKEILSPQLAHPERLRDTYRLPCYGRYSKLNAKSQSVNWPASTSQIRVRCHFTF